MASLSDLDFGFADAETESSEAPALLLAGFFDENGWADRLRMDMHCLVLGSKGAGKTALAEHIRLSGAESGDYYAASVNLRSFPFRQFRQISNQGEDDVSRVPDIWTWLLSLLVFELLGHDDRLDAGQDWYRARAELQRAGLLPTADLPRLVREASKSSLRLQLAPQIGYTLDGEERDFSVGPNFGPFVRRFRDVLYEIRPSVPNILFIDGLDEVDLSAPQHLRVLGALVDASVELNRGFRARGLPVKVVTLCRTDVFDRIDSPNKNKTRQDYGMDLDWYDQVWSPQRSRLIKLADSKARVNDATIESVLRQFFPSKVKGIGTASFLGSRTRHLPRDYLRLLTFIREAAGDIATVESIHDGMRRYSQLYFLPELRDSMSGFCDSEAIDLGFAVLGSVGAIEFDTERLERSSLLDRSQFGQMESFLNALFEAGGVGLIEPQRGNEVNYAFKYRTTTRRLDPDRKLRLHPGLWPALNLRAEGRSRPTVGRP